jgi:protease I
MSKLAGLKVAILATDGFEQSELVKPRAALDAEGAITKIVSPKKGKVRGWQNGNWADELPVDVHLFSAQAADYDVLLLPGGVINPDHLRMIPQAVEFVKAFADAGKPIAAICHGPWTLINAGVVKGKTVTSWPSIKIDLINAGANWLDKEVVVDGNLVTSRKPDDIPAFNRTIIAVFSK